MGIRQTTPMGEIDRQLEEAIAVAKRFWVKRLSVIGEKCVNKARSLPGPNLAVFWDSEKGQPKRHIPKHTPGYIDWTANLRSSIGYVVVMDGQIMDMSSFEPVKGKSGDGKEGSKSGKEFARSFASKFPNDIALIVVAGMAYADYVQRDGYDVTASAELLAEELLAKLGVNPKIQHFKQ